jgi:hypothetical protein
MSTYADLDKISTELMSLEQKYRDKLVGNADKLVRYFPEGLQELAHHPLAGEVMRTGMNVETVVNSWNEGDPIKHIIVGRADDRMVPAPENAMARHTKLDPVWFNDECRHIQEEHGGTRHSSIKYYYRPKIKIIPYTYTAFCGSGPIPYV